VRIRLISGSQACQLVCSTRIIDLVCIQRLLTI
jgi:hypothetical protein